jgi:hypothetical protein
MAVSIVFGFSTEGTSGIILNNFILSDHRDLLFLFACIKDVLTVVVLHVEIL